MRRTILPSALLVAAILHSPPTALAADGSGIRGWGPRVGLASDPDQLVLGLHLDAGRLATRVRFQPDVEVGIGDDFVILGISAPVHYRFPVKGDIAPYAGGGVTVGYIDFDAPDGYRGDDDDVDFAIDLIGGLEWTLRSGNLFFVEFDLLVGDLQDFELLAGWTFR